MQKLERYGNVKQYPFTVVLCSYVIGMFLVYAPFFTGQYILLLPPFNHESTLFPHIPLCGLEISLYLLSSLILLLMPLLDRGWYSRLVIIDHRFWDSCYMFSHKWHVKI